MFQIGSANRGSAFRSQGYLAAAPVLEGIHLLFYNVGVLSYTTGEKLCILKGWGINTLIAIELANISYFLLYMAPVGLLLW